MADEEIEALDVAGKNPVKTGDEADAIHTDNKRVPESDPPATSLVQPMPMPTDQTPIDTEEDDLSFVTNRAKLLNLSEDWIEKRKQQYRERAALSKRIMDQFRAELIKNQGYFDEEEEDDDEDDSDEDDEDDSEEEDDDDYEANFARVEELNTRLWNEHCDFSGLVLEEDNVYDDGYL